MPVPKAVMLAFNAVNNLFGVGTSSMMSRSLGRGDHEMGGSSSRKLLDRRGGFLWWKNCEI